MVRIITWMRIACAIAYVSLHTNYTKEFLQITTHIDEHLDNKTLMVISN